MESRNMYMYMLSGDSVLRMAATVYCVEKRRKNYGTSRRKRIL